MATASKLPDIDLNPRREPVLDFPDRELGELTPADYDRLGFLCGLEVHQQLETTSKLFCRCPAGHFTSQADAEVLRHMRPTLSELGQYDGCALMEFKTRKEVVYLLEHGMVCTYEMDDTPPFHIDEQAVKLALSISRSFNLNLASELEVMRKQYLDGSIPTGFQRTAMVGVGGTIPFRDSELGPRELRIRQLTLEEDSCREVSDVGHRVVFRTDRLGMPLVETVTEPDLLTPIDVQRGARLLARVAHAGGHVRRGAGAARQDVNVSIAGSRRIEIKGVCTHRILPKLVHVEAYRHLQLLRIRDVLHRRGLRAEDFALPARGLPWEVSELALDVTATLGAGAPPPIQAAIEQGGIVCAVKMPGFHGLLGHPTQPGRDFGHELSERVRVIACLTGTPFFGHCEGDGAPLPAAIWRQLRSAVGASTEDGVVAVWGPADDVETAVREILLRAEDALIGVPSETRQPHPDGTTGFERILPGPDRMYPDTDTPPLPIPDRWIEEVGRDRPEMPWQREDRYRALGLPPAVVAAMIDAPWTALFDAVAPGEGKSALRLAHTMISRLPCFFREIREVRLPAATRLSPLVTAHRAERLRDDAFVLAFDRLIRDPSLDPEAVIGEYQRPVEEPALADAVAQAIAGASRVTAKAEGAKLRFSLGQVMHRLRGRIDPDTVRARVQTALEEAGRGR